MTTAKEVKEVIVYNSTDLPAHTGYGSTEEEALKDAIRSLPQGTDRSDLRYDAGYPVPQSLLQ